MGGNRIKQEVTKIKKQDDLMERRICTMNITRYLRLSVRKGIFRYSYRLDTGYNKEEKNDKKWGGTKRVMGQVYINYFSVVRTF